MQKLVEMLGGLLGKTPGEMAGLTDQDGAISESGLAQLKTGFEEKFNRLSRDGKTEGHGRGLKEALEAKEKVLAEKYGVTKAPIDELIEAIVSKEREELKVNPADVKKSDVFVNAMKAKESLIDDLKAELTKKEAEMTQTIKTTAVRSLVPDLLTKHSYVLPENDARKAKLMDVLLADLMAGNYEINEAGVPVPVDQDGNPIRHKDNLENMTFEDVFLNVADIVLEKAPVNPRRAPGVVTPRKSEGGGNEFSFAKPANSEAAINHLYTLTDSKERAAYSDYIGELEAKGELDSN